MKKDTINEREIRCRSEWDIVYAGVLTSDMIFQGINDYQVHTRPLSIFKDNINFHSHKALLFKEKYIPFIYDIIGNVDYFINKRVKIVTSKGCGVISLTLESSSKEEINYRFSSSNVLCSDLEGMAFLKKNNIKKIAMRGECINDISLASTLNYAVKMFDEVIYRFSDINNNSIIEARGTSLLLNAKKEALNDELNCVLNIYKNHPNLSVLCPFVRTGDDAIEILNHIRHVFSGKTGCMIEVPLIIYEASKFTHLYDFYVIGISDLCQLLQAADRNIYPVQVNTVSFIAELLESYFFPYISNNKDTYITDKLLFEILKTKNRMHNLLYLSK